MLFNGPVKSNGKCILYSNREANSNNIANQNSKSNRESNDNGRVRTAYVWICMKINGTGKTGRTHEMKNCERTINTSTKRIVRIKCTPANGIYAWECWDWRTHAFVDSAHIWFCCCCCRCRVRVCRRCLANVMLFCTFGWSWTLCDTNFQCIVGQKKLPCGTATYTSCFFFLMSTVRILYTHAWV